MMRALTLRILRRHLAVERDTRLAHHCNALRLVPFGEHDRMTTLRTDNRIADDRRAGRARLRRDRSS